MWKKLSQGGEKGKCGWLKDKCGISWQISPSVLGQMMQDKDTEKLERVMKALMQMKKSDMKTLEKANKQN